MQNVMWAEVGTLALAAVGVGVLSLVYNPQSFSGGRVSEKEARREQLLMLESMFAERFPVRNYDLVPERFTFVIPNEHEGMDGIEITVDFVFEMSVWYFGDLFHVHYCGDEVGNNRDDVEQRIDLLLKQLDRIFQEKIRFYWCRCGECGPDGMYDVDETPAIVDKCGAPEEHISWSGVVPI